MLYKTFNILLVCTVGVFVIKLLQNIHKNLKNYRHVARATFTFNGSQNRKEPQKKSTAQMVLPFAIVIKNKFLPTLMTSQDQICSHRVHAVYAI